MPWTTTDRDALKAAIANGVKSVRYTDREVEYRSMDEMLQALALIEAELAQADERPRTFTSYSRKGM